MKAPMLVQAGAEAVNEGDSLDVQGCFVHIRRTKAESPQALRDEPWYRSWQCRPIQSVWR